MKPVVDILILIAVSALIAYQNFMLGMFLFLLGGFFSVQFWRTRHLLGDFTTKPSRIRMAQAAVLTLLISALVGPIVFLAPESKDAGVTLQEAWNHDLFPVYLGATLMVAVALVSLLVERRKR